MGDRFRRLRRPVLKLALRRTTPLSETWGFDRGTPIDRFHIDEFLEAHRQDIRGSVLEVADTRYTDRFGAGVSEKHVLDVAAENPRATVIGDLNDPETLPQQAHDCFVLTQTLQYVFDLSAAVDSVHRVLKPGGVALVTVPSVSRIAASAGVDGEYWRFTAASCARLFARRFENVEVRTYGNVLSGVAFLLGLAAEDLQSRKLGVHDPFFPVLIAVRAQKA